MFEKESNGMSEEERTDFVIALKRKMCLENGKVTDADVYFQGVKDGYNKANEWHKVDEGKYPSEEQLGESFIVAFAFNKGTQKYYSFDCAEYIDKGKFCTHTNNDDKVIAWKEIPLFKEK